MSQKIALEPAEMKKAVETLLFITDSPIPLARLAQLVGAKDTAGVESLVRELQAQYEERGSAVQLLEIADGFQMATRPAYSPFVRKLFAERMTLRLSTAALETLSIIAYRQPITRAEIEEVRGVEVIAALETLLDRRLVRVVGRKETVGRPLLYGTTPDFLRHFGLKSLSEMPPLDSFEPKAPDPEAQGRAQAVEPSAPAEEPAPGADDPGQRDPSAE